MHCPFLRVLALSEDMVWCFRKQNSLVVGVCLKVFKTMTLCHSQELIVSKYVAPYYNDAMWMIFQKRRVLGADILSIKKFHNHDCVTCTNELSPTMLPKDDMNEFAEKKQESVVALDCFKCNDWIQWLCNSSHVQISTPSTKQRQVIPKW